MPGSPAGAATEPSHGSSVVPGYSLGRWCSERAPWQIWADTGGTFTDCLAVDPQGRLHRAKVLSSSALRLRVESVEPGREGAVVRVDAAPELVDGLLRGCRAGIPGDPRSLAEVVGFEAVGGRLLLDRLQHGEAEAIAAARSCEVRAGVPAPVLAAHIVTRTPLDQSLPKVAMRVATTRGTNALLERRGAVTALLVTAGFGDLLEIGDQQRPDLFNLIVERPRPLPEVVLEVRERIAADGSVIAPLDPDLVTRLVGDLHDRGVESVAIALMHSYRNPQHEVLLAQSLRESGIVHVSCSAELAPLIKLLPRAETAVVDAYLSPVIAGYVDEVAAAVQRGSLHVMTSAGGLSRAADFRAKDSLLSGPAGGVVGASTVAARSGFGSIIAFDMGGTSTDVARWQGELEYVFEHSVGGARLMAPALAIESVAAGGGSICHFDGDRLLVGPHSAGADPGPACYGAGGPLAMTDVNLLLGRIDPDRFEIPLAPRCSAERLDELLDDVLRCSGERLARETALEGFLQIANERMASAIRRISVRQGHDPRASVLVAFGGAGPQHAVAVADLLDITTVLVPEDASLLSALGLGHAQVERFAHEQVLELLEHCSATLQERVGGLLGLARERLRSEMLEDGLGVSGAVEERCLVAMRMKGQESALEIPWREGIDLEAAFGERYEAVFGYAPPGGSIEVESLRAIARERRSPLVAVVPEAVADQDLGRSSLPGGPAGGDDGGGLKEGWGVEQQRRRVHLGGAWEEIPVLERALIAPGFSMKGPLLVAEPHSVTVVEPGWRLERDQAAALVLRRGRSEDEVDDAG